jgi:hypothetical protein
MMRKIASVIFLLDSVVIGLGAFGHGLQVHRLHAAIDLFPIESDMHSMLYVVWYFVSGCMFTFGATLVWVWQRARIGDNRPLFAAVLIGLLYAAIGGFGLVYRQGDPFMGFFLLLGVVLLLTTYALSPRTRPGTR